MWLIVLKEIRDFLYSPKFMLLFIAAFILVMASVANGYWNYEKEVAFAESSQKEALEKLQKNSDYRRVSYSITRRPSTLSIFDPGVSGFIGRKSYATSYSDDVTFYKGLQFYTSSAKYTDDPILAMFGELSLSFVVSVVFSLFAILMGYNSISGEKEDGTLKLILSTGSSRSQFFFGKIIGGFIPLALLLLLPLLFCLICLMLLTDISFSNSDYFALLLQVAGYLGFIFLFFIIALTCSAFTRRSFISFMASLIIWVVVVAIIPKAVTQFSERAAGLPDIASIRKERDTFNEQLWDERSKQMVEFINKEKVTEKNYRDKRNEFYDKSNKEMQKKMQVHDEQMRQETQRRVRKFENSLESSARVTPYASMQFIAQGSANTDFKLLKYMQEQVEQFEKILDEFANKKRKDKEEEQKKNKYKDEYNIKPDASGYMKLKFTNVKNERVKLDMSGLPRFEMNDPDPEMLLEKLTMDFAFLFVFSILFLISGFFRFQNYDVR
jgi:ABC-type transport system involved in multi-copper enzyme maturation permease subunit